MQKNKNRSGLAIAVVSALFASLFGAVPAAQAANEAAPVITVVGADATQVQMLHGESMQLFTRDGSSEAGTPGTWSYHIVSSSTSGMIVKKGSTTSSLTQVNLNTVSADVSGWINTATGESYLDLSVVGFTSVSPSVTLTVTPYRDRDSSGTMTAADVKGDAVAVTFVPWSTLGAVLTLEQPVAHQTAATTSLVVSSGAINWSQLNSSFKINIASTGNSQNTDSATVTGAQLVGLVDSNGTTEFGASSMSYATPTDALTASATLPQSVSAQAFYGGNALTAIVELAVSARTIAGLTMSSVIGANLIKKDEDEAYARYNSAFVINAYAHTTSETTSMAVARTVTVSAHVGLELDADSGIIIAGTTHTSSATLNVFSFTLAAGTNTIAISTFGQEEDNSDYISLHMTSQLAEDDYTINFVADALTVDYTATTPVVSRAGAPRTFTVDIEDRWGEATERLDLRVAASVVLGASTSTTVSATVVGSEATVTVTPTPATRTGSATVTFTLEYYAPNSRSWVKIDSDTETWDVFSYAAGTDAFVSRTVSVSGTISYGVKAYSWSDTIAVVVANSFSDVVVSAPGLVIQNADVTAQTASGTLTAAANGKTANFKFAGPLAGTFTVTFTNGTAVTTSQVVIQPAADSAGTAITFDTTAIPAASTKVITGTLVDANGNPVNTSGSATILVTYTVTGNAGIPIGTMPTETDADGQFKITVLTGANDSGTAVVSATYYKNGAATAVADVLTFNQSIVVGGAAVAAPSADQKLTVGSFKGFVAIYALNYTGQKLSAKVAGKWLVVNELTRFQRVVRNTGAGYTIKVDLHIDGVFVRSETIVTK